MELGSLYRIFLYEVAGLVHIVEGTLSTVLDAETPEPCSLSSRGSGRVSLPLHALSHPCLAGCIPSCLSVRGMYLTALPASFCAVLAKDRSPFSRGRVIGLRTSLGIVRDPRPQQRWHQRLLCSALGGRCSERYRGAGVYHIASYSHCLWAEGLHCAARPCVVCCCSTCTACAQWSSARPVQTGRLLLAALHGIAVVVCEWRAGQSTCATRFVMGN
jgi:hypothetical protein